MRKATFAITIACFLAIASLSSIIIVPEEASAYTPHNPIYIDGNGDFTSANGVTSGSGLPSDPFIIEGWEINASVAFGIEIRNASAHFVIRDVYVHSGGMQSDGIYIFNTRNGVLENNTLLDNWNGIRLHSCNNTTITANNFSDNWQGISLPSSTNVTVVGNNFTGNRDGASIWFSYGINITGNNFSLNSARAINLHYSNKVNITSNNMLNNGAGIDLDDSSNITIFDNNISSNDWYGVLVGSSTYANMGRNTFDSNGVNILGPDLAHYNTHTITSDNSVNGKPLYYYKDCNSVDIDGIPTGQLIVANCTNFRAANLEIADTDIGINMAFVNNTTLEGNNISKNNFWYGIWLYLALNTIVTDNEIAFNNGHGISVHSTTGVIANNEIASNKGDGLNVGYSSNITVTRNNVSNNEIGVDISGSNNITVANNTVSQNVWGVEVSSSTNNRVYHNNFIDNGNQSCDGSPNLWDNGYPSGGNYWSDYTGVDNKSGANQDQPGSDGIGDTPYDVVGGVNRDRYPLMSPLGTIYSRPPMISQTILSGKDWENVTIIWSLSPDDGMGFRSIVGYDVYRNMTYNPQGMGYQKIANLPNGTSQFIDNSAGEGNPNIYFYRVCAVDLSNNTSCAINQAGKFTRPLSKGPNLVSVPLIQSNESVERVLQTVKYDKVWSYDSFATEWKSYMTFKPAKGELITINHKMGVWVNVTKDSNLTIAGMVPLTTTVQLRPGWSLVSFPSFSSTYTVGNLKAETGATKVEGFDSQAPPYHLRVMNDGEFLQAGHSYWIYIESDRIWTVTNS